MKFVTLTAAVLALALAGPAASQAPSVADTPVLEGAQAAPDCDGMIRAGSGAFCVRALLFSLTDLSEAYIADFESRGWQAVDGGLNRVILVRPRPEGGCDGVQMQGMYDESRTPGPATVGYLAFAAIPGDVCVTPSAALQ